MIDALERDLLATVLDRMVALEHRVKELELDNQAQDTVIGELTTYVRAIRARIQADEGRGVEAADAAYVRNLSGTRHFDYNGIPRASRR